MAKSEDAIELNRLWFNERAELHATSDFYRVRDVIDGEVRLQPHEIAEVGCVAGKDVIQLQCHIGLEAVSWARLGARSVTGLDISETSLEQANSIAKLAGVEVDYVCGDVYKAVEATGEREFDVVYVNGNSLAWLPDLPSWAHVTERLLRPGGMLYLNLFHPLSFSLDPETGALNRDYFDRGLTIWDEPGSYVDDQADTANNQHAIWLRPVGDAINAVIGAGLSVVSFTERAGQEFQQFPTQVQSQDGLWYNSTELGFQHPSTYSLVAIKSETSV